MRAVAPPVSSGPFPPRVLLLSPPVCLPQRERARILLLLLLVPQPHGGLQIHRTQTVVSRDGASRWKANWTRNFASYEDLRILLSWNDTRVIERQNLSTYLNAEKEGARFRVPLLLQLLERLTCCSQFFLGCRQVRRQRVKFQRCLRGLLPLTVELNKIRLICGRHITGGPICIFVAWNWL